MPQIDQIVLTDGTSPITLTPVSGNNVAGQTRYWDPTSPNPAASPEALYSSKRNATTKVQKQYLRTTQPQTFVSTDTGETIVRGTVIIETNITVSPEVTPVNRALAVNRHFSAIDAAALETELTTGEGQW